MATRITSSFLPEVEKQLSDVLEKYADDMMSEKKPTATEAILAERGKRYGSFAQHARISQALKDLVRSFMGAKWDRMHSDQQEAFEMICHKMARIINGDPDYHDSWADIAGYAKLVADRLETGKEA